MKNLFQSFTKRPASPPQLDLKDPFGILHRAEFVSERWYRATYKLTSSVPAAHHYLMSGCTQGFEPNPLFRGRWYVKRYPGVAESQLNPAVHYLVIGSKGGMRPNPFFDPAWYRSTYSDVAALDVEPLCHYLNSGAREGRNPSCDVTTQWLPQALDPHTGAPENPLATFLDLLDILSAGTVLPNAQLNSTQGG